MSISSKQNLVGNLDQSINTPSASDVDSPLAKVLITDTVCDAVLLSDGDSSPIGRIHLAIALEVGSHVVTGYRFSCAMSSDQLKAECLIHSILPKKDSLAIHGVRGLWPVRGLPRSVLIDAGLGAGLEALKHACTQHGLKLERATRAPTAYMAWAEKFFRSLNESIGIFSESKSDKKNKPELGAAFHDFVEMTKFEFESFLMNFIVNVHNPRAQMALATSPRTKGR